MAKWNRKGLTPEEREKRKEALRQQVERIINNFENSPKSIVEYLEFNSKFHQYSTNNTILIYEQNQFARFCASYKSFQDMGYQVQKGQTGMKIFVPYITTVFHDPESNQWIKLSEGTKEQKALVKSGQLESKQYTSFGIGTVFDIGQTDCPPEDYPKLFDMGFASETHNRLYQALVNYAESQNISVAEKFLPSISIRGYYQRSDNSIILSDKLNDSMKLSVMAHELSHAIMHSNDEAASLPQMQKEIEADSLSLMIRQHLGISDIEDIRRDHLKSAYKTYIKMINENASDNEYPDLSKILDNVNKAYTDIIEDFDKSINNYLELHQETEKNFSQTIDDFLDGRINPYAQIFICKTTNAMIACGAKDLDVIINQSTLRKVMSDDAAKFKHPHNLDKEIIKAIPGELNNPIMILNGSEQNSIVLVSSLTDENNQNIIISCRLNSEKSIYEVNEITSIYPKNNISNYINAQLNKHNLIGCNKKRANRLLKSLGLQSSEVEASIDYTNIIPSIDKNVNSNSLAKEENIMKDKIYASETTIIFDNQETFDEQAQFSYEIKEIAQWSDDKNYLNFSVAVDDYLFDGTFRINDDVNGKGMRIVGINCYSSKQEDKVSGIWDRLEKQLQDKATQIQQVSKFSELDIKFNGDYWSIIDKSTQKELELPSGDSTSEILNIIAQEHPEYREFINNNFEKLIDDIARAEQAISDEAIIVEHDRLSAAISQGGFGEDMADSAAYHKLQHLENLMSTPDNVLESNIEPEKLTLKEYLAQRGLASPVDDFMIDKLKLPHGQSKYDERKMHENARKSRQEYHSRRNVAIQEYQEKVATGEIIEPTNLERYIKAAQGHPDNASTQAARRVLAKRGYTQNENGNWILKEPEIKQIENVAKLPEGWKWIDNEDLSGHLQAPDGTEYFSYDWSTYEYKIYEKDKYDVFFNDGTHTPGTLSEFKEYAAKFVNNIIVKNIKADAELKATINNQLEQADEIPVDVLCDDGKIEWYSFAGGINDTEKVKKLLQNIQKTEKQVVSISSDKNTNKIVCLNDDLQFSLYHYDVYPDADAALKAVLSNDNIAKLVPYEDMMRARDTQDLKTLSECDNKKYPFIKINRSDNTELAQEGYLPFDKAEELFKDINKANREKGLLEKTSASLFLDSQNTYNLDLKLGSETGGITEHLNQLINESDISSDKSLQTLKEFLKENGLITEQQFQSAQTTQMNFFEITESM